MSDAHTLADRIGITYRQLDHWTRKGYLKADGGEGTGHRRDYNTTESRVAAAMAALVGYGLTPEAAHFLARCPGNAADKVIEAIREAHDHAREAA